MGTCRNLLMHFHPDAATRPTPPSQTIIYRADICSPHYATNPLNEVIRPKGLLQSVTDGVFLPEMGIPWRTGFFHCEVYQGALKVLSVYFSERTNQENTNWFLQTNDNNLTKRAKSTLSALFAHQRHYAEGTECLFRPDLRARLVVR
mgnify:CR=1 FL=1